LAPSSTLFPYTTLFRSDLLLLHPEIVAAVHLELVELDEAAGVEEELDPLAGGELAFLVLLLDPLLAAAQLRLQVERGELFPRSELRQSRGALGGGNAAGRLGLRKFLPGRVGHRRETTPPLPE